MNRNYTIGGALIVFLLLANAGYSQQFYDNRYWLGLGAGRTSQFPSGMMALGYEFAHKPTQLVARYVLNSEVLSDAQPAIRVNEIGMLYGVRAGKFRFSTGLSGVWGTNRGKFLQSDPDPLLYGSAYYERLTYTTVGIPAEIRFITSTKDVGVGVTAFGNLNAKRSFVGLNLSLYVGQMK
ncbi:hypothetical protein [Spirosoma sp. 209]|uniref:hypothetical protein n=1 Tax=Spirosoma sp. 209 TaxID=1955701 RepID=UPI00098D5B8A|nr:hypothetical protein [Spirosoma sp. 209]